MKTIIVIVMGIMFCPSLKTEDDWPSEILCVIVGSDIHSDFKFNVAEIPDGCDVIIIGQYYTDRNDGVVIHITKSNEDVMRALNTANKVVYTKLGLFYNDSTWDQIFAPENEERQKVEAIGPLVTFLNDFKISGLLLNIYEIYDVMDDFPGQINTFINQVKQGVKHKIKFGLIIDALTYKRFSEISSFDFTVTNGVLDIYLIDFLNINSCNSDGKKYGLAPVTCPSPNMTTMEQVTSAVTSSTMDKSKIYAWLQSVILIPAGQPLIYDLPSTTYSKYCSTNTTNATYWCQNRPQLSYDQAAFAKKNYKGIVIECLDADDFNSSCGCGQFPVTKAFISGWKSSTLAPCSRLN